jgi:hypothetical protein
MAVPDALGAWREFVGNRPTEPDQHNHRQLAALSSEAKVEYDEARIAWLAADVVLETKDTKDLERQTRITLARNAAQTATARRGLALSGAAGLGKCTAALIDRQAAREDDARKDWPKRRQLCTCRLRRSSARHHTEDDDARLR